MLSGEWYDGTRWFVNIETNTSEATILAILIGDVDLSGHVDDDDLSLLLANWGTGNTWGTGDLNDSGTVDDDDLSLILAQWNMGAPPMDGEAVPEPATLGLLAAGGLALIRRRQ